MLMLADDELDNFGVYTSTWKVPFPYFTSLTFVILVGVVEALPICVMVALA
jgi:hypothetical protein